MDYLWIAVAFVCGFLVKQIKLPPLVGYLVAGFGLHALGFEPDTALQVLSHFGITLLLFTIGLKFDIKSLFKAEIWNGAVGHMCTMVLLTALSCLLFGWMGFAYFVKLDWQSAALIGFAISFSSTVFAVKVLEDRGEMRARHGQIAIGILIIQDIMAVIFVAFSTDTSPSFWAFTLLALPLLRPIVYKVLQRCGHGEMLPLAGFFFAFSAGQLFELCGLEAHLGALVVGMLLSDHSKATELAKSLLSFKDIFLIGFFLSIGFTALPTIDMLSVALIMAIALPLKAGLFFLWLTQLKLRVRTSFLTSMSLANYSEFGLIVCSVSVANGLLPKEWLVIMALAVAFSFIFSSLLNIKAHELYAYWSSLIKRFEKLERLPDDQFSQPEDAMILVIGMGRVGTGAYEHLQERLQKNICGLDVDKERVIHHCSVGRNVIMADAEDPDFWAHINLDDIHLIMLAIPDYMDILEVTKQLQLAGYQGKTAGIARYKDEERELSAAGIDVVFNFYRKAGTGFAEQSMQLFETAKEE